MTTATFNPNDPVYVSSHHDGGWRCAHGVVFSVDGDMATIEVEITKIAHGGQAYTLGKTFVHLPTYALLHAKGKSVEQLMAEDAGDLERKALCEAEAQARYRGERMEHFRRVNETENVGSTMADADHDGHG